MKTGSALWEAFAAFLPMVLIVPEGSEKARDAFVSILGYALLLAALRHVATIFFPYPRGRAGPLKAQASFIAMGIGWFLNVLCLDTLGWRAAFGASLLFGGLYSKLMCVLFREDVKGKGWAHMAGFAARQWARSAIMMFVAAMAYEQEYLKTQGGTGG